MQEAASSVGGFNYISCFIQLYIPILVDCLKRNPHSGVPRQFFILATIIDPPVFNLQSINVNDITNIQLHQLCFRNRLKCAGLWPSVHFHSFFDFHLSNQRLGVFITNCFI